jgi:ABC-type sugar transport system substrate-binding protein
VVRGEHALIARRTAGAGALGLAASSLAASLTVFLTACGGPGSGAATTKAATTKVVGVTLLTREQGFYQDLEAGLRAEAEKKGYRVIITSGDFDLSKQQAQIENFVVQHVDAIIVCPVNSQGIGPAIGRATAARIPVVSADTKATDARVLSAVASDNRAGGRLAATYMVRALGDSGAVAVIGQPETQTGLDRQQAFLDELSHHPRMAVVAVLNGGGVRDRALKAADDILQGHPDLRGIFAINYDATPEAVTAIKAHSILKADVAQQPREIGARAVDAVAAYIAGQPTDSVVTVPVRLVEADAP